MKTYRIIFLSSFLAQIFFLSTALNAAPPQPVIDCHISHPTEDKPQSKVWYANGGWWAWLPDGDWGGRLWRREQNGTWQAQEYLDKELKLLPGRADVWAEGGRVVAALNGKKHREKVLAVAALQWSAESGRYELEKPPLSWKESGAVETLTLAREKDGSFWVAYPLISPDGLMIVVRNLGRELSSIGSRVVLAQGLYKDEICAITSFEDEPGVGVLWSDQNREALVFRKHPPNAPDSLWTPDDTVAVGGKTADDHINFCIPPLGSGLKLVAATKTSLDSVGETLLALRVLTADNRWHTTHFATLTDKEHPSRPIALWIGDRPVALYTTYGTRRLLLQEFSSDGLTPLGEAREIIPPVETLNNVTGPKRLTKGTPPLILASDREGKVYEALIIP